jgi:hypothetical protein
VLDSPSMAYDAVRGRMVLAGDATKREVWEWDGSRWTLAPDAPGPLPRRSAELVWDGVRQRVVLLGGNYLPVDAWEWDGSSWQERVAAGGPPPGRWGHSVGHDPGRGALAVFGGWGTGGDLADTWELTGGPGTWQWSQRGSGPASRGGGAMFFDGTRLVLLGGAGPGQNGHDGWAWDGLAWQQLSPVAAPYDWPNFSGRAWDPVGQRAVLQCSGGLPWAWEWSGSALRLIPQPVGARWPACLDASPQKVHPMAFDTTRGRAVLHGLDGLTWEWEADARTPSFQLDADFGSAGVDAGQVSAIRIRARAGGSSGAGAGARLLAWRTGGGGRGASWYATSAQTTAGVPLAPGSGMISWDAPADQVAAFLAGRSPKVYARVAPLATPSVDAPAARLEADYLEVRIRYQAR